MSSEITHPNYCPAFYKILHVVEQNNNISAGHCCISEMGPPVDYIDFHTNKFLDNNRKLWPTTQLKGCQSCWSNEAADQHSLRQYNIEWIKDLNLDPTSTELIKLDYSVGKLCNAKCIMCSSNVSTTWMAEDYKFKGIKQPINLFDNTDNSRAQHLDLSKLQILYFTGGEPLMTNSPLDMLKMIKSTQGSLSNLTFQTNTNGSIVPSKELIELWKECKQVEIFASIDATGKAFEYIRNPLSWNQVEENLDYITTLNPNIQIHIALTLGLHNIDELEKTYNWYLSKSWDKEKNPFTLHKCYGTYALENASTQMLELWKSKISSMDYPWQNEVLTMIDIPSKNNSKWISHLEMMDLRRNLSWANDLPELYKIHRL